LSGSIVDQQRIGNGESVLLGPRAEEALGSSYLDGSAASNRREYSVGAIISVLRLLDRIGDRSAS
jgi:hypothetical protein